MSISIYRLKIQCYEPTRHEQDMNWYMYDCVSISQYANQIQLYKNREMAAKLLILIFIDQPSAPRTCFNKKVNKRNVAFYMKLRTWTGNKMF